jgi:molybdopterin-guanine dinucleotide biosynthesis protein A
MQIPEKSVSIVLLAGGVGKRMGVWSTWSLIV